MSTEIHPVDEVLPVPRLLALGLQHVLVMYAGAVAVPLIIGRSVETAAGRRRLSDQRRSVCLRPRHAGAVYRISRCRYPAAGDDGRDLRVRRPDAVDGDLTPEIGLLGIYGSVIAAGIFGIIVAPFISRLLPLFPPVVTGTIIMVIGISLMRVGINWAGGGLPTLTKAIDGARLQLSQSRLTASCRGSASRSSCCLFILGLIRWGTGFIANVSVLLGIIAGAVLASVLGVMHFEKVLAASWGDIVIPFRFGVPQFHLVPILTMCIVMIVVMIESLGMFLALGEMTGKTIDRDALSRGLRADGVGTLIGGVFNTFPYTSFSQNVGLVSVTGVRSRWVTITGGAIMLLLGLLPKLAALVEAVPLVVLGRRGPRDVRHGGCDRRADPDRCRLQEQPLQPVRGRDLGRLRHDPARRARLLPQPAARSSAAAGIRHSAVRGHGRDPECVLQWDRQQFERESRRRGDGLIRAACLR